MSGKNHTYYYFNALIIAAVITLLAGCDGDSEKIKVSPPDVIVSCVEKKDVPIYDLQNGNISSVKVVKIIPRISGYIDEVYFKDGSVVKKGDPLYLIDPRPFQAEVDSAAAQLQTDQQKLDFAEIQAQRYTKLYKENATSEQTMQDKVSNRDQLLATVAKDKANLENAKLNLGYTSITAPFSGYIQKTNLHEGALVTMQQTVLTTLIQIDPMHIYFSVSRNTAYKIQQMKLQNKIFPLEKIVIRIYLPDGSMYDEKGKIDYMSFMINEATDCIKIRGVIANKCKDKDVYLLIPGQYAPVKMIYGEYKGALLIPQAAVVSSQLGTHAYVVDKDNKVHIRKVEQGSVYGSMVHILNGLSENENVVVQGVQKIRDGMTVKISTAKPKPQTK